MKISIEFLEEKSACQDGIDWFVNQNETELVSVLRALEKDDHASWANWLIVRCMTRPQYLAYAIYAAEQVMEIYEKKHPGNTAPRNALDAAKKVLEADTEENRQIAAEAADASAYAAVSAAYAAYAASAAYAAVSAASAASAAYAADAAAYAAASAAYAAAYAADASANAKNMYAKILNYGIELIQGGAKP